MERLRKAGFDVTAIPRDQQRASDESVLELAGSEDRILITEDRDFGELAIRKRLPVAGVVLLDLDQLSNAAEAGRVLNVV